MSLTAAELERGWVEFHCPAHGFLVATIPTAVVKCACGQPAARFRNGKKLTGRAVGDVEKRFQKYLQMSTSKSTILPLPPRNGSGKARRPVR